MYQHYFFDKMKKTEAKMHAQQIIRREQEQLELLMEKNKAQQAKIHELEQENKILLIRLHRSF